MVLKKPNLYKNMCDSEYQPMSWWICQIMGWVLILAVSYATVLCVCSIYISMEFKNFLCCPSQKMMLLSTIKIYKHVSQFLRDVVEVKCIWLCNTALMVLINPFMFFWSLTLHEKNMRDTFLFLWNLWSGRGVDLVGLLPGVYNHFLLQINWKKRSRPTHCVLELTQNK